MVDNYSLTSDKNKLRTDSTPQIYCHAYYYAQCLKGSALSSRFSRIYGNLFTRGAFNIFASQTYPHLYVRFCLNEKLNR